VRLSSKMDVMTSVNLATWADDAVLDNIGRVLQINGFACLKMSRPATNSLFVYVFMWRFFVCLWEGSVFRVM